MGIMAVMNDHHDHREEWLILKVLTHAHLMIIVGWREGERDS